jgi:hypothetical protein
LAISDPVDTLAYHASRILCEHRDMSGVPCASVATAMKAFMAKDTEKHTVPESEALWFYGMNHGMALISAHRAPLEPLNPWELTFVSTYHAKMASKAVRAFYYLIWICTREARHNGSLTKDLPAIGKAFGPEMQAFLSDIKGGETGISQKFLDNPPKTSIGKYCDALRWAFFNSKWSSGYGGKKWGVINDCLCRFVNGEFAAEMMLDTIWTLQHNGGCLFNKGFCYTHESATLARILDVQRSGQIPEAVLTDYQTQPFVQAELKATMLALKAAFTGKIGEYVDWYKVEALGSVHKYGNDKQKQDAKYGQSPEQKALLAKQKADAEAAVKLAEEKAQQKKLDHEKNWFTVMPDVEVKKVKIARAA